MEKKIKQYNLKNKDKKGMAIVFFGEKDKFTNYGWFNVFFYNDKTKYDLIDYKKEQPNSNDSRTYTNKKDTLKMLRKEYSKLFYFREEN